MSIIISLLDAANKSMELSESVDAFDTDALDQAQCDAIEQFRLKLDDAADYMQELADALDK
jgi:hypothetical protein